ncbi:PREDICTED: SLAM family member 7 isoform X1 [Cercocebus atys]|uniref:SLAM family member 7 n=1 Tax=Cercocebus atys TaxID=9531 RepID=A0A2K5NP35_CERAT|nr:PREDICTED: SLAM family member 7 isoform X1 [Cercocebus atys]
MAGSPTCFTLIYILWQLTGSTASGSVKELVGSIGGAVTFPLKSEVKQVDSIVWTFNTTTLVTIQPEGGPMIVTQNRNKERVDFPDGGYSLKLSKLKKNDSGIYNVEIYSSSLQDPFTRKYVLRVYEHLSKPKVTMGLQSNKNGTCVTNLTCRMEHGEEDVIYTWKALGQAVNESHNGSILPISWRWGESDMTFICTVRNPVSSNSSSPILARKLCEGAADDSDSSMVLLCLLLVPLLLSLFVLGLFLWFLKRETQEESIKEKKRADICRETPNICPYSGENTEYDTIPYTNRTIPMEDAANTLYSTVEIPKKIENPHSLLTMPDTPRLFAYENVI